MRQKANKSALGQHSRVLELCFFGISVCSASGSSVPLFHRVSEASPYLWACDDKSSVGSFFLLIDNLKIVVLFPNAEYVGHFCFICPPCRFYGILGKDMKAIQNQAVQ